MKNKLIFYSFAILFWAVSVLSASAQNLVGKERPESHASDSLSVKEDLSEIQTGVDGIIIFPGLDFENGDADVYFERRLSDLTASVLRPEFSNVPAKVRAMPLHIVTGRYVTDIFGLYTHTSAFAGVCITLTPWVDLNIGGVVGMSMLRDCMPLNDTGMRMSLVFKPSDQTIMELWGQMTQVTRISPIPASMPPTGIQRMSVGANAKFKIGDASIGVSASFSTY